MRSADVLKLESNVKNEKGKAVVIVFHSFEENNKVGENVNE